MYNGKTILALIPARAGSKRLPYKNTRPLLGKPLISWTIEQAKNSKYIDATVVSTDDQKLSEISRQWGADVPFLRPKGLATDRAKVIDVIIHAIDWFERNGKSYDLIILLQPTSPLRLPEDIDKTIKYLFLREAKAVVSVSEVDCHPYWMNTLPNNGSMMNFLRHDVMNRNKQELPVFYRLNGALYLAYSDYLKKQRSFFGNDTFAYIMPRERSVDIDDEIDFCLAETIFRRKLKMDRGE